METEFVIRCNRAEVDLLEEALVLLRNKATLERADAQRQAYPMCGPIQDVMPLTLEDRARDRIRYDRACARERSVSALLRSVSGR